MTFPTDEELKNAGWIRRSRRPHNLHSTPRVGQVYWVDFPTDAYSPEFEEMHPGVIIRAARTFADHCIVIPLTHREQRNNPHAYKLMKNPRPDDSAASWAVCDHIYTIALGPLRPITNRHGKPLNPRVDLTAIFTRIQGVLAAVFTAPPPPPLPPPAQPRPLGPRTLTLKKLG